MLIASIAIIWLVLFTGLGLTVVTMIVLEPLAVENPVLVYIPYAMSLLLLIWNCLGMIYIGFRCAIPISKEKRLRKEGKL